MIVPSLNFHRRIFSFVIGFFLLAALISPGHSLGQSTPQSPRLLITWRAESYVPAAYPGKTLPGPGSVVAASVEVIDQGKIADLSRNNIYWYLDGLLVGSGVGKNTVSVKVGKQALQETELMVQIPGYKGDLLIDTVVLFISSPVAVIEAPYAERNFGSGSVTVRGTPYFFNVPDISTLIYNWTVNGVSAPAATSTEGKTELAVNVNPDAAPGAQLDIDLTIRDPKDQFYYGAGNVTLNFAK